MRQRHPRPESPLAFPDADGERERALDLFGIDIERSLRAWFTEMGFTEERVNELLARRGGAVGLVGKPQSTLAANELTGRQREALSYMACGYSRTETGELMDCAMETVKAHLDHARFRLGTASVVQAAFIAALLGELDDEIIHEHLLRNWDL